MYPTHKTERPGFCRSTHPREASLRYRLHFQLRPIAKTLGRDVNPLGLVAVALIIFAFGCTASEAVDAAPSQLANCPNGTQMISPISSKPITKTANTPAVVWDGKLYMFCCDVDKEKFKTNPKLHSQGIFPPNAMILSEDP